MQVFETVLSKELGPTRPVAHISEGEQHELQRLVVKHASHLRESQGDVYQKIQEKMAIHGVPRSVKILFWVFTPPSPRDPWWMVCISPVSLFCNFLCGTLVPHLHRQSVKDVASVAATVSKMLTAAETATEDSQCPSKTSFPCGTKAVGGWQQQIACPVCFEALPKEGKSSRRK